MGSQSGAVPHPPTVEVVVEKPEGSDPAALAKVVQGTVLSKGRGTRWKWTKAKKEAFRLIMQGASIVEAADKAKTHRNNLTRWMKAPEWLAEAQRTVNESQVTTKLRRLKMTSVIADQLGAKTLKALTEDKDLDVSKTGLTLRSHLEYVRAERELFGEGDRGQAPGGPGTALHIHLGAPGQPQALGGPNTTTAVMAFKDFCDKYDPKLAVVAVDPVLAAALLMEKTLQESNLLDIIREEDRETMRQEAEVTEEAKRRR